MLVLVASDRRLFKRASFSHVSQGKRILWVSSCGAVNHHIRQLCILHNCVYGVSPQIKFS